MTKSTNLQAVQANESDGNHIQFEGERFLQFYQLLCEALDANEALSTTSEHFPDPETEPGTIDPRVAVDAYGGTVRDRLNQMLSMIDGDDIRNAPDAQKALPPISVNQLHDQATRTAIRDIYNRVTSALTSVVQANCSMGAIAKTLEPMEYVDGVMCPELVIPLLVKATSESLKAAYEILEELEELAERRGIA